MLGVSNPGNGRLALALLDTLIKQMLAQGLISQTDLDALMAEAAARLETENTITSAGALIALNSSKIGQ
jgi:hypothetical protein